MTALASTTAATHDVVLASGGGVAGIGIGGFFVALICAFICVKLAGSKNRSGLLWGVLGFVINILAVIILLLLPASS